MKQELGNHGLAPEDWGGDTIVVPVSAKSKEGIPQLLEMLLLQADVLELQANPKRLAKGTIIEARLDRGRGPVATVLVQEGTLKVGDPFVVGTQFGRRGRGQGDCAPAIPRLRRLEHQPTALSLFERALDPHDRRRTVKIDVLPTERQHLAT